MTAWRWPLDLARYNRRPALTRREVAALARRARYPQRLGHWTPLFHDELGRLTRPVTDALDCLQIRHRLRGEVQRLVTHELHRWQSTYWAWSEDTWHTIIGTSRLHFEALADGPQCRAAIVAVALLLQRPIAVPRLGRFDRVALAYRLFGRTRVDAALDRILRALVDWGYAPTSPRYTSLRMTLCEVFLTIQSPCLEQISIEVLLGLRTATSSHKRLRGDLLRLSRALVGLGLITSPLNPWATKRPGTSPSPTVQSVRTSPLTLTPRSCRSGARSSSGGAPRRPCRLRREPPITRNS